MHDFEPRIVAFCCANCASSAEAVANDMGEALPDNVKTVRVPCTGRIDILHLLKAFEEGADGVYVAGCQEDSCRYTSGIDKAAKRVARVKAVLSELDIEPERIELFHMSAARGVKCAENARDMVRRLRDLGPIYDTSNS